MWEQISLAINDQNNLKQSVKQNHNHSKNNKIKRVEEQINREDRDLFNQLSMSFLQRDTKEVTIN